MSFTIAKEAFISVIQKAFPVIPTRTSLQVLYNFKITIENNTLELIASDLDNFVKTTSKVDGDKTAEIVVNARKLFEIVREIDDEVITIIIKDNTLFMESASGFSCNIVGVDIREFPHFPDNNHGVVHSIETKIFKNIVSKSAFAVSKDESRACLCGVLWESCADRTGMVATDGHRLGASFQSVTTGLEEEISIIVPQKSLLNIIKTADLEGVDSINYSLADKHIVFSTSQFTLSAKIIDGPYPDYEKGIPKEFSKSAIVDRKSFLQAVRRVSVLSNKNTQLIKMVFNETSFNVSAVNREIGGEAQQTLPVEYSGEADHTIGFNSSYLLEILSIITTEKVQLDMNTQVSAAVLFPKYEENSKVSDDIFLIMPLRIFE